MKQLIFGTSTSGLVAPVVGRWRPLCASVEVFHQAPARGRWGVWAGARHARCRSGRLTASDNTFNAGALCHRPACVFDISSGGCRSNGASECLKCPRVARWLETFHLTDAVTLNRKQSNVFTSLYGSSFTFAESEQTFGSHMSPAGSRLFELFNVTDACRAFSQLSCLIKDSSPLSPANGRATQPVSQCCKLAALISRTKLGTQGESFLLGTHEDVRQEVSRWRLQREFETSPGLQEKRLGACWFVVSKVGSLYFWLYEITRSEAPEHRSFPHLRRTKIVFT